MIQVLISTMHLKDAVVLLENMNIQTSAVIIDQTDYNGEESIDYNGKKVSIFHTTERGLSKSRNMAISKATADILILADDDFTYIDGYEKIVEDAYNQYDKAEAVVFTAKRIDGHIYRRIPDGIMNRRYRYSINSVRITIKKSVLIEKNISFDEAFGAGSDICCGEDNIFINDCYKNSIKIYSKDMILCRGYDNGRSSTYWIGFKEKYLNDIGSVYKRLSKNYFPMVIYFALRSYKKYHKDFSFFTAVKWMLEGAKRKL